MPTRQIRDDIQPIVPQVRLHSLRGVRIHEAEHLFPPVQTVAQEQGECGPVLLFGFVEGA